MQSHFKLDEMPMFKVTVENPAGEVFVSGADMGFYESLQNRACKTGGNVATVLLCLAMDGLTEEKIRIYRDNRGLRGVVNGLRCRIDRHRRKGQSKRGQ